MSQKFSFQLWPLRIEGEGVLCATYAVAVTLCVVGFLLWRWEFVVPLVIGVITQHGVPPA